MDLSASELVVQSHAGPYRVVFEDGALAALGREPPDDAHVVVDRRVAELYAAELAQVLAATSTLVIEATEDAKSLERLPDYIEHLVGHGIRRGHVLVAVGGGIVQDIVAFLAATLLRGLEWRFYPTTLLAQADSCIGSKSSINARGVKNILGTYTPPAEVVVDASLLATLTDVDLRSGIGEILKVHAIDGPETFDALAQDYARLIADRDVLARSIVRALEIKRRIIEEDEFDTGPRLVMNYGHSFGHAIEAATEFGIPHGIAVTIGMDMANHVSARLGVGTPAHHGRMHPTLVANYAGFERREIPFDSFLTAIARDKKNVGAALRLVLPDAEGRIGLHVVPNDDAFRAAAGEYLESGR